MNRIKQLRNEKNINQDVLAKLLGLEVAGISKLETERVPLKDEYILKLADYFGVTTDYLLCKSNNKNPSKDFKQNANSAIVLVYGTIPAGIPLEMIEDIIDTEEIPAEMLKGDKQYFGLKVKGNSMENEYHDGDIIICEKVEDCESGDECIVMVNGFDGTFKKVIKNENGIILQPLNPTYAPLIYSNEEIEKLPVKIIGKVVELRRKK